MNNNFLDLSLETLNNLNNDLEEVETHIKNGYVTFYDCLILDFAPFLSIGLDKVIKIIEKREEGKA